MPYRDLPAWVRDGGYAEPSAEEKNSKAAFAETGLTQSERNQVFNAFAADVEILATMSERETARFAALDHRCRTFEKYGVMWCWML